MDSDRAVAALAALAHQVRLDVWHLLLPYGQSGLSAGMIAARLAVAPSSLSFHLMQMAHGGVLLHRRSSRRVIYAVNQEVVSDLFGFLNGDDVFPPIAGLFAARQTVDVIGDRQGEHGPIRFGDDLAPAADI